jgi:hypothetical protein
VTETPVCEKSERLVHGIRPFYRKMRVLYEPGNRVEHLTLDFYDETLHDGDVYGVASYLRFNGQWMVREVSWRWEDRIRPVVITFLRPSDWAKYEVPRDF